MQRETTTDRLADLVDLIQIGHKTGTLTVERGENSTFEEGLITFVRGQITQAKVGASNGAMALTQLMTWQTCRFRFASASSDATSFPAQMPPRASPALAPLENGHSPPSMYWNDRQGQPHAPQRLRKGSVSLAEMEGAGLSRVHLRLFLLIDGQRTVQLLAQLMGRNPYELQQLLNDLVQVGLIQQ